jgi:hypothetical protein
MSRTKGHTKSQKEYKFPYRNKMPPYLADKDKGRVEFIVDKSDYTIGITKTSKLITKNANRSLKKAARQQWKKEINK